MGVRLAIVGARGRMGQRLVALAGEDERLGVAAEIDVEGPSLGDLDAAGVDCVIDFSVRDNVWATVRWCADNGVPLVLGTTGLEAKEHAAVDRCAESVAVVFAPNFSVGVNLLFALAGQAAKMLGEDFDIEVVEAHHRHKVDAPSGTAVRLGEVLAEARGWDYREVVEGGREGLVGARPDAQIGMSVVRGGDVVGEHDVMFLGAGEQIVLRHRATNRDIFVRGALRAARWVVDQKPGLYDMQSVLMGPC